MKEVKSLIFGIGTVAMAMVCGASLLINAAWVHSIIRDCEKKENNHDD